MVTVEQMSALSDAERRGLEGFRDFKLSLAGFAATQQRRLTFDFRPTSPYTRSLHKKSGPAQPGVIVNREHLVRAWEKWRANEITAVDLADWASMLVMNDDYAFVESESELIAEWLNGITAGDEATNPKPC